MVWVWGAAGAWRAGLGMVWVWFPGCLGSPSEGLWERNAGGIFWSDGTELSHLELSEWLGAPWAAVIAHGHVQSSRKNGYN